MSVALVDVARFLIVLGLVIVFHEFGHLVIAKVAGARVERFSIGFGRRLFGITWRGTEYIVSALPLGGYVKITGMDPEDELTGAPWEFFSLPAWKRISVVFAGPVMNFVLALLIYYVLFIAAGESVISTTTLGLVRDGGIGWEIGLHSGDRVVAVDGKSVSKWTDISAAIEANQVGDIALTVQRDSQRLEKTVPQSPLIDPSDTTLTEEKIEQLLDRDGLLVGRVQEDSPAAAAGLVPGCIITAVNGQPLISARELAGQISEQYIRQENGIFRPVHFRLTWTDLNEQEHKAEVLPTLFYPAPDAEPYHPKSRIGIVFTPEETVRDVFIFQTHLDIAPKLDPVVGLAKEGGPARRAGLGAGCRIIDIDGTPIDDWNTVVDIVLSSYMGEGEEVRELEVTWVTPDQEVRTASITPEVSRETLPTRRGLRMGERVNVAELGIVRKTERIRYGIIGAGPKALEKLHWACGMLFFFLSKVITGEYSARNLGGPVAIAELAVRTGRWGLEKYFSFIALLSANLAILNLLPIPPLDGGHVVLYVSQWLRKRPVTLKQMETFAKIGFVFLIPLILFLFWNDLDRLLFDRFDLFNRIKELLHGLWPQT